MKTNNKQAAAPLEQGGLELEEPSNETLPTQQSFVNQSNSQYISVHLHVDDDPYVRVRRHMLEDSSLSWKAKGLLAYLLSRPVQWKVREADLINKSVNGRDSVRGAIIELESVGYVNRVTERNSGKFLQMRWDVSDKPIFSVSQPQTGLPQTDYPATVIPATGNPLYIKKDRTKKDCSKKDGTKDFFVGGEFFSSDESGLPVEAELWNEHCGPLLKKVEHCASARLGHLKARRKDLYWKKNFVAAIQRIAKSDFCTGNNDRRWMASFDWLLKPETISKVMEGKYDDRPLLRPVFRGSNI